MDDERPTEVTDAVLWVDTDVMLADPLTKRMDAKKLWEALDSNFWDMKQPIESLRKKKLKQEQRRKTEQFTEEEKKEMKSGWRRLSRNVFTNKFLTQFMGGPPRDAVVWREITDLDVGIVLEDKPKESINKRDLTNTLGKKMNLKITLHTDVDSHPTPSPDLGEFHMSAEDVYDEPGY